MSNVKLTEKFLQVALEHYDDKRGIPVLSLVENLGDVREYVSFLCRENYVKVKYYLRRLLSLEGPYSSKRKALEAFNKHILQGTLPTTIDFDEVLELYLEPTEKFFNELLPSFGSLVDWSPNSRRGFYYSLYVSLTYMRRMEKVPEKASYFHNIVVRLLRNALEPQKFTVYKEYKINGERIDIYCEKKDNESHIIWVVEVKHSDKPYIKDEGAFRPFSQLIDYVNRVKEGKENIKEITALLFTDTITHPQEALKLRDLSDPKYGIHYHIFELYNWLLFFKNAISNNYGHPYKVLKTAMSKLSEIVYRDKRKESLRNLYMQLWSQLLELQRKFI